MTESAEYLSEQTSHNENISNEKLIDEEKKDEIINVPITENQITTIKNENINNNLLINNPNSLNYYDSIISDFDKILYYNDKNNYFNSGIDGILPYPYIYNPTKLNLNCYCKCNCCDIQNNCDCLNYNNIIECLLSILPSYLHAFIEIRTWYEFLSVFNGVTIPIFLLKFFYYLIYGFFSNEGKEKSPNFSNFITLIVLYIIGLLVQLFLTYYSLSKPINYEQLIEKMKNKFKILPRIYFSDNRKIIPFNYKYFHDISGNLIINEKNAVIELVSKPGIYFIDNNSIKHYYKTCEKLKLNGSNDKFYINYENIEKLNQHFDYENQNLYSMFSNHEINELKLQKNELIFLSKESNEKWTQEALIYFFSLQGYIFNGIFLKYANIKQYKIRKVIFINEPNSELKEQMSKYTPFINYQGNEYKFDNDLNGTINDINNKYFDEWDKQFKDDNLNIFI